MSISTSLSKLKKASYKLAGLDVKTVNKVLLGIAKELIAEQKNILAANAKDLKLMDKNDPKYDRAMLTIGRIKGMAEQLKEVAKLKSPLNIVLEKTVRPSGLKITKMSLPLGVIGIIYESRPNVTIEVFSLCFKAGNACALKGGKEVKNSNAVLVNIIKKVLNKYQVDSNCVYLLPADRKATAELLKSNKYVDVLIPRGSNNLINFVRENSSIPVIETGAGVVHTYFDESGDLKKGQQIIYNAKTRRPSVCNALDTLIIHESRLKDLPKLVELLKPDRVEIFADTKSYAALSHCHPEESRFASGRRGIPQLSTSLVRDGGFFAEFTPSKTEGLRMTDCYPANLLHKAKPQDFGREFLSLKMSIKTVKNLNEALAHIAKYSSKHSEAIVSQNQTNIKCFLNEVDAAAVYSNASTTFTDGGQFGLGSEIGISTQKLHARGPLGLKELTSYKWVVVGKGQVRPKE